MNLPAGPERIARDPENLNRYDVLTISVFIHTCQLVLNLHPIA